MKKRGESKQLSGATNRFRSEEIGMLKDLIRRACTPIDLLHNYTCFEPLSGWNWWWRQAEELLTAPISLSNVIDLVEQDLVCAWLGKRDGMRLGREMQQ